MSTATATVVRDAARHSLREVTSSITVKTTDHTIVINGTSITLTLPGASGNKQVLWLVNKSSDQTVTINTASASEYLGTSSSTSYTLAAESTIGLHADGSDRWHVLGLSTTGTV